jgi:hypothetical protein
MLHGGTRGICSGKLTRELRAASSSLMRSRPDTSRVLAGMDPRDIGMEGKTFVACRRLCNKVIVSCVAPGNRAMTDGVDQK